MVGGTALPRCGVCHGKEPFSPAVQWTARLGEKARPEQALGLGLALDPASEALVVKEVLAGL